MSRNMYGRLVRLPSLLVAVAALGAVLVLLAVSLPDLLNGHSYVVRSGSMEPAIQTGSVVVTHVVPPATLKQGDIITFQSDTAAGVNVTHRIVGISQLNGKLRISTKGDANGAVDVGNVDVTKPVAKVLYWVPWVGYIIVYLALGQIGMRLLLVGCGLLLLWARLSVGTQPRPTPNMSLPATAGPEPEVGR